MQYVRWCDSPAEIEQDESSTMLSKAQNDLLTQTGPGTPCGQFLRSYWQPIAAAEEMPTGGAPLPLRIMSEDLVLFRDDKDRLRLVGPFFPPPGDPLFSAG